MTLPGFPDATPIAGLAGGVLIGLAAAIMLLGAGRILGASGMIAKAVGLGGSGIARSGSWAFVVGVPLGAFLVALLLGGVRAEFPTAWVIAVAGVLVGMGARLGSGCTSGHGVCGVSRLSGRSIVATISFMTTGIVTVAVMNASGLESLR
jgi:uncharacterized membrane protein YedE/YeeE